MRRFRAAMVMSPVTSTLFVTAEDLALLRWLERQDRSAEGSLRFARTLPGGREFPALRGDFRILENRVEAVQQIVRIHAQREQVLV